MDRFAALNKGALSISCASVLSLALIFLTPPNVSAETLRPQFKEGEYVVTLHPQAHSSSLKSLSETLGMEVVRRLSPISDAYLARTSNDTPADQVKSRLLSKSMVRAVDRNRIFYAVNAPNDPEMVKLWGMQNTGQLDVQDPSKSGKTGVPGVDIGAEQAWKIHTGTKSIVVAVIDTGIQYTHPDLKDNMWVNTAEERGVKGVDDDGNGYVDDIYGYDFSNKDGDPMDDNQHGTHCAGTIGARGNNNTGVVGVNWETRLMAVKFLSGSGSGELADAVSAIDYATQMGAHVLSNSWGGGGFDQSLFDAINRSYQKGRLFVAAAGNDGLDSDRYEFFPAEYNVPNVMSIAALTNQGTLAYFSNYGANSVDIAAPGFNIYSTTIGGRYEYLSGTSMATPHVAGIAALLWSYDSRLDAVEVKNRLMKTGKPMFALKGKLIEPKVANAQYALLDQIPPADPNDPSAWKSQPISVSSPHPYTDSSDQSWTVSRPGAKRIAIYFEKFETEKNYDKVSFIDANGNVLGSMSGKNNGGYSQVFNTDTITMRFTSDKTVSGYGFDATKIMWE